MFCIIEDNIVFPSRFKMDRVYISMENDPVCHISTKIVMGQVIQVGPMEYPQSLEHCRVNWAFDFLGTGLHFK